MPRVSVVMPTRDRRHMLARALASVQAQTFRDFEVVVVDDGSTDGTAFWLRANYSGVSLVEIGQPSGAAAARNRGVDRSGGEIVAFLDDDDVWRPSYLETQVARLNTHPEAELCTAAHVDVDAAGRVSQPDLRPLYHYPVPLVHLLAECPIHTLSVVTCRRAAFERIGPFDETLPIVHDLDWYLRLIASGGKVEHSSTALVEHAVPARLVTRHRQWFQEERSVHRRFFAKGRLAPEHQRLIRAARALLFARVGLTKWDLAFGLARLTEAILVSPIDAVDVMARKLRRRRRSADAWGAATGDAG